MHQLASPVLGEAERVSGADVPGEQMSEHAPNSVGTSRCLLAAGACGVT